MAIELAIPGVDFCEFALRYERRGIEVPWWHVKHCAPCIIEYRRITAYNLGWPPVSHDIARLMFNERARMLRDGKNHSREDDYRKFWAHLANCTACVHNFALIAAGIDATDDRILERHWPLPVDLSLQNGHQSSFA